MSILPRTEQRRRRLTLAIVLSVGIGSAIFVFSLSNVDAISMFHSPTDIKTGKVQGKRRIEMGGIVVKGSRKQLADGVTVQFAVTDMRNSVTVQYKGILPDMFKEGKGAVAKGKINDKGVLVADKVLAKHDEKYMPPAVKKELDKQKLRATLK